MLSFLKSQFEFFIIAIMYFTRIPVPIKIDYTEEKLNASAKYFPLVGVIVGGSAALTVFLLNKILPLDIAIIISMILTIVMTGAFHEDGLADYMDSYGGYTKEKILTIMKDSRIGTFGSLALVLILLLKFLSLNHISLSILFAAIILGNSLSRLVTVTFIFTHRYVRENDNTYAKPIVRNSIKPIPLFFASIFGLIPFIFLPPKFLLVVIPLIALRFLFSRSLNKRLGGYTGDCLGAIQQLSEVTIYVSIIILLSITAF